MNLMDIRQSTQFSNDKDNASKKMQFGIFKKARVVVDDDEDEPD